MQRRGKRQHGDLHHVVGLGVIINPPQSVRIHQVLRVVRQDHVEAGAVLFFPQQHALVDPVETVGLGCGAVVGTNRKVYVRVILHGLAGRRLGGTVVGINPNEELDLRVILPSGIVLDHAADHAVFSPRRDKNGHQARGRCIEIGIGGSSLAQVAEQGGTVDEQVIDTVDQHPKGEWDQKARHPMIDSHAVWRKWLGGGELLRNFSARGIYSNVSFDPVDENPAGWKWYNEDIQSSRRRICRAWIYGNTA